MPKKPPPGKPREPTPPLTEGGVRDVTGEPKPAPPVTTEDSGDAES